MVSAVELLEERRPGKPVVVRGASMGAAAAVFACGTLGSRVSAYLLESPYIDLHTAARRRLSMRLPPLVDRVAYAGMSFAAGWILDDLDGPSPCEILQAVPQEVSFLFLSGSEDERSPPADVKRLSDCANGPGRLVIVEEARHESLRAVDPGAYVAEVQRFLSPFLSASSSESDR